MTSITARPASTVTEASPATTHVLRARRRGVAARAAGLGVVAASVLATVGAGSAQATGPAAGIGAAKAATSCPATPGVYPAPPRDRVSGSVRCSDAGRVLAAISKREWSGFRIRHGRSFRVSASGRRWSCRARLGKGAEEIRCRSVGRSGTLVTYRVFGD